MDRAQHRAPLITARQSGRVACRSCGRVATAGTTQCSRCGAPLRSRDPLSLQKVWAWWVAGLIAYIPANLYPMLVTTQIFTTTDNTILGGVVQFLHHGDYFVALVIFVASVVIPVGKFVAIAWLALIMARPHSQDTHLLHRVYEVVEFIGRWSMVDVFVVAILSAMVQFGAVATIKPGIAAVCFAVSVIFTMISAQSFDSRLIWDRLKKGGHAHDG